MIPATIKHADLMAAVEPLLTLLGTDAMRVYNEPGVSITFGAGVEPDDIASVALTVVRGDDADDIDPAAHREPVTVGDGEWAEFGVRVTVRVI